MAEKSANQSFSQSSNQNSNQSMGASALEGLIIPPDEMTNSAKQATLYSGLLLFLVLLSILIWRGIKHARTPATIANKKLDALERELMAGKQTKQQAQRLISILSAGLGVNYLDQYQSDDIAGWASFKKNLNSACFSKGSADDIKVLIKQARLYLKAHQNLNTLQNNPEKAQ